MRMPWIAGRSSEWKAPEEGGFEAMRTTMLLTMETLTEEEREVADRVYCRFCIARRSRAERKASVDSRISLPTVTVETWEAGTKGAMLAAIHWEVKGGKLARDGMSSLATTMTMQVLVLTSTLIITRASPYMQSFEIEVDGNNFERIEEIDE